MTILLDEFNDFSTEFPLLTLYFQFWMAAVTISFPIISLILFPFYVRINRENRKRDAQTAVFPITNYFFITTCVTETLCIIGIILSPFAFLFSLLFENVWPIFMRAYWIPVLFIKMNVSMAVNIIISFLALQRCLLYFSPKVERSSSPSKRIIKLLLFLMHAFVLVSISIALDSFGVSEEEQKIWDRKMQIVQLSLNGLVILCTLPYFLMVMSIRKLTQLTSNLQSSPEKYIKYQIMIILFSKLLLVPFLFTVEKSKDCSCNMRAPLFAQQLACETLMTPLIIQAAYFLSNKTNFDALKRSMRSWKSLKKPFHGMNSKVKPTQLVYTIPTSEEFLIS